MTKAPPIVAPTGVPTAIAASVHAAAGVEVSDAQDEESFYKAYEEHSKVLRAWLVAYGVGAPVLFLTNDKLSSTLSASSAAPAIAGLFLAGVAVQVLLATVNKTAMWGCYYAVRHPAKTRGRIRFRFAEWVSEQFWIDFVADIATLVLFGIATWGAFRLFVAAA
jgi:hypothetical protein